MIKEELKQLLAVAVEKAFPGATARVDLDIPSNPKFGDYSTNVALSLAKSVKQAPVAVAKAIQAAIQDTTGLIESSSIAGPGFLNFTIQPKRWIAALKEIATSKEGFGICNAYQSKKALVEFVSANPTGPLHIGHGRNAVVGDTLANLLRAVGYQVEKEYYVNDGGIQITTLGKSVWARMRELKGEKIDFPENAYQGDYIRDIAKDVIAQGEDLSKLSEDAIIQKLGLYAGDRILEEIKADLRNIRVEFDHYFFESTLYKNKDVDQALADLKDKNLSYSEDGALWLKSTDFGDDKNRVLIKKDGSYTYLTPDISYHRKKYERGYDLMVNIWGADHAGYVPRLKAAIAGLGRDAEKLKVVLIQMVSLIRAGQLLSMSTRKAQYETLEAVVKEVGPDATRYFFMMRSYQAQLDFDLELAKQRSSENPVYYIQYAHARICSIFAKAADEGKFSGDPLAYSDAIPGLLTLPEETALTRFLLNYPETILKAADELQPHRVATYAMDLARGFQSYYDKARNDERYRVLSGSSEMIAAKLFLLACVRQVLQNTLSVLGVSAPEKM